MRKGIFYSVIKNRTVTLFVVILIAFLGLYNYHFLPRQETPDVSAPVARITTVYQGSSPEEIEKSVTSKIEDALISIEGYDYSKSISRNGISTVLLFLTNDVDIENAWNNLRMLMDDVQSELPEQCSDIDVNTSLFDTAGMIISLSGENYSYEQLADFGEEFEKRLSQINGMLKFELIGKSEEEIKVKVNAQKLIQYDLSMAELVGIIKSSNTTIPLGSLDDGSTLINVRSNGSYASLDEIKNTIIGGSKESGGLARLKDVADIYYGLEDSSYKIRHNGEKSVLLTGYFKQNENIVLIGKDVEIATEELKISLPKDVKVDYVLFQPKDVDVATTDFIMNLLEGMLFVIIVVFVGMGLRNAVVVSTAIPISILVAFSAMKLLEIEIHQISITALIIALGMLVDNAIVVSDSIQVRIDDGEDKMEACINGTKETAIPILTSTLTTMAVFTPLLMLSGTAGDFLSSIPRICIVALSASYGVALFVTPTMSYMLLEKSKKEIKVSKFRRFFSNMLEITMKKKYITLAVLLVLFIGAISLVKVLGLEFFPTADKNIIYININSEKKGDLSKTEEITNQVEKILSIQEEVINYTSAIGDGLPKFYFTVQPGIQASDYAQILVELDLKKGGRFKSNDELCDYLQNVIDTSVAGGKASVKQLETGSSTGDPVKIMISGDDMDKIAEASKQIKEMLYVIEGTVNINDDYSHKQYEFFVNINNDTANILGLTKVDIQKEISIALKGTNSSVFKKDDDEYNIMVNSNIKTKEQLENLEIKSSVTGSKVLLKQVADVELISQVPKVNKYNREKTIIVGSDVKAGYSSVSIQNKLEKSLVGTDFDDIRISFNGEREAISKNFGDLGIVSIFAMIVIYIILLIQFGSLLQPLIIMLSIPLSIIGSVLGLYVFRQPLSLTALFGIVSLIGIVVNNAIILIDYINLERAHGKNLEDACKEAASKRLRPVLLTTVTTVIGLIPLAFSGSSLFGPMSIALMSGLSVSTILTLVVIPMVYSLVMNNKIFK